MVRVFTFLLLSLGLWPAAAAHTEARLVFDAEIARPGSTVMAGIHLRMDEHWHTYWINPGASGMATAIAWKLPPGIKAGEIQWPIPEKLPPEDLTTYVYHNEVILLVPLTLDPELAPGKVEIGADVSWLECQVQCLPGDQTVKQSLSIGKEAKSSPDAALIKKWLARLPAPSDPLSPSAKWVGVEKDGVRAFEIRWKPAAASPKVDFFPLAAETYEVQPNTRQMPFEKGEVVLQAQVKKLDGQWPSVVRGILIEETGGERRGYAAALRFDAEPNPTGTSSKSASAVPAKPLWLVLVYAFLGGLILNIMPCVLPVIALKILGFVGQAREQPRKVRVLGLVYTGGVIISFLLLAGLVIAVNAAGKQAGWGMQFGNPQFLVLLTILVTLVALNLFGLFEITPGARVMDTAGALASKHGPMGAFFNGVLATILATPCTAPFLGAALGFAFVQNSALLILLIFLVIGLGLAAPYAVLSWNPSWLKFLPKPGAWMEHFKVLMGFPMLATAIWLYSLTPIHYGERSWWLAMFLVVLGLAAYVYGQFVQRSRSNRTIPLLVAVLIVSLGFVYTMEAQLRWRAPLKASSNSSTPLARDPEGIAWIPWSPEAVAQARAQGKPVLVDFTADWCLTCKANKKFALEISSVRNKLKEINAVALLGDYTLLPDNITAELRRFGRAGVPLVVVYPADTSADPIVLPEALTAGLVLDALDRAKKR